MNIAQRMLGSILVLTLLWLFEVAAHADPNPKRNAYFGETHMHTAFSLDAYIGGARLMPTDAYRYARGKTVSVNGKPRKRRRPLDFAAVTDHAEYLGEMYSTMYKEAPGHNQDLLKQLRNLKSDEEKRRWFIKYVVKNNRGSKPQHPPFFVGESTVKSAWQIAVEAADKHNEPGKFTAFIAFEWSGAPGGANLHRNVIFRDSNVPETPVSYIDINREDGLWAWMAVNEKRGVKALAIPHNSNASKGGMFTPVDAQGDTIDLEYARTRQHFEPLIEIMQIKGNSEVHRSFWTADEFAKFENADSIQKSSQRIFRKRDFVREGLKLGLLHKKKLGVNPFKYGIVGGTDNHNGLPSAVAEDRFIGGHGPEDGTVERRRTGNVSGWIDGKDLSIGSLTGVWATENTREAIWDAMKRRETFATSGPRIKVRFFGGADLPENPNNPNELVEKGYLLGVPMGGNLSPTAAAPNFTVVATKDPDGANLDRIQIIKGWVNEDGQLHEKIVNVVWSGDRKLSQDEKLPMVGNTVNLKTAEYTNNIGETALIGSWKDSEFDPAKNAVYYARVLEIPTPRWTTHDAVRNKLPLLDGVNATIQERAWTSPIWYSP